MSKLLVLGTNNKKKGIELRELLAPYGFELKTLADFDNAIDVVEDGDSFQANAHLKAIQQAKNLGLWVLGEDSGLSVDHLDGAPGIYSARYAGEDSNDEANNDKLLQALDGVPAEKRTAHYTCHASLSDPNGNILIDCEEYCCGRIRFERHGSGGFGYDPLFELPEYHLTFGQLGAAVKSVLSHRSRALRKFIPQLCHLANTVDW